MPPTESQILLQTLLPPSSLSTILPLTQFTALFPPSQRSSPQIPTLYRALQLQRGLDLDAIRANITAQARVGREQMREFARTRARDARASGQQVDAYAFSNANVTGLRRNQNEDEDGDDLDPDGDGSGNAARAPVLQASRKRKLHSGKSLCEGMEEAETELRAEISALDEEARMLIEECEGIVDELGGLEMDSGGGLAVGEGKGLVDELLALRRRLLDQRGDGSGR